MKTARPGATEVSGPAPVVAAPPRRSGVILAVLCSAQIILAVDVTVVNVANASIERALGFTSANLQWTITAYALTFGGFLLLGGRMADLFGRRRLFIWGVSAFALASLGAGVAHNAVELIAARAAQGLCAAVISPAVLSLLAATFPEGRPRQRAYGMWATAGSIGGLTGFLFGGFITSVLGWRWIFFINVPIGIVATALALRILPASGRQEQPPRLDLGGLVLMATGLPLLTYGLGEIGVTGRFSITGAVGPAVAGLVLIALFALHALRAEAPLLDLRLLRRSTYGSASLVIFLLGAPLFGALILLPLYFQQVRHESVFHTGLLLAPQGIGMVCVMPFVGRLVNRVGGGLLACGGVLLMVVTGIPFGLIGAHTSIVWLSAVQVVRGVGVGFALMPAFVAAFGSLERHELPDAAPQLNVLMRIGGSIGTAALAVVLSRAIIAAGHSPSASASAGAFGSSFWWAIGLSAVAFAPCAALATAERSSRRARLADPRGALASEPHAVELVP